MSRFVALLLTLVSTGVSVGLMTPDDAVKRLTPDPIFEIDPADGPICIEWCPESSSPVCLDALNYYCPASRLGGFWSE